MKKFTTLPVQNKRLVMILACIAALLCVPLIAMQFTPDISWSLQDFIVMGTLLLATGLGCEWTLRKIRNKAYRLLICLSVLAIFFIAWAELAVGIF